MSTDSRVSKFHSHAGPRIAGKHPSQRDEITAVIKNKTTLKPDISNYGSLVNDSLDSNESFLRLGIDEIRPFRVGRVREMKRRTGSVQEAGTMTSLPSVRDIT